MNKTTPEALALVRPCIEWADEIGRVRTEALADPLMGARRHLPGTSSLENYADPTAWVAHCAVRAEGIDLSPGDVACEQWMLVRQGSQRILGLINIRLNLGTDFLREFGGHIGYLIRPSERGKRLAEQQLRLALDRCRSLGLRPVLLTCEEHNQASRATIVGCGGLFERTTFWADEGIDMQRYWITP